MKMRQIVILAPLFLSQLALIGCRKKDDSTELIRPVRTMRVADAEQLSRRVFPGRAEATQAVDMAFEVQGQLIERPVNVGDQVAKGATLARIDARDYENDLQAAQARLELAVTLLKRVDQAVKSGAISQQDLTDAQAKRDMAQATVRIKEKAVADTSLVAPFAGTIAATYIENFQNVEKKQIVLRLLDTSKMELKIDVPEQLIMLSPYIKDITVAFEASPDAPVPAEVKEIGTEASSTTRTYPVTLIMDQPQNFTILAGMTGTVRGRPDPPGEITAAGFEILGAAVFEEAGKSFVWVVDETALTVQRHEVNPTGVSSFGVKVEGLEAGQTIVTAGTHHLREGQRIRLMDEVQPSE